MYLCEENTVQDVENRLLKASTLYKNTCHDELFDTEMRKFNETQDSLIIKPAENET